MNKMNKMTVLATGIGLACAVSCSTMQKKNTVAMDRDEINRRVASAYDVGVVGPKGEVILFYKKGGNIVVQQCQDNTVLSKRSDCQTKDGTTVAYVPVDEFKNRLKAALKLPVGNYSPDMQGKLAIYRKGFEGNTQNLLQQQQQLQASIAQIQAFINAYGSANADNGKLSQLQQQLASVNTQLGDNSQLETIIQEINGLVDHLVDQLISQPTLTSFVFSKDGQSFGFNILRTYIRTPGLSATFASIPAGSFQMGSPVSETGRYDDENQHYVNIGHVFEMEATDVTQLQWFLVMGYNPSYFKTQNYCQNDYLEINGATLCPNNPVEQVSWDDAQAFIQKLNAHSLEGYTYRLPTEAEWEYAARAGSQAAYFFGNDPSQLDANSWYSNNSGSQTHAVGTKPANGFGLYDMSGNVWQWVQDWYGNYPNRAADPTGPSSGSYRVFRGGSWGSDAAYCRSAYRYYDDSGVRYVDLGFRLVRTR